MLSTNASKGVHQIAFQIRVPAELLDEVYKVLDECKIRKTHLTLLPFSDGSKNQLIIMFTCTRSSAETCRQALGRGNIGIPSSDTDVNVFPLAIAKDLRSDEEKLADEQNKDKAKPASMNETLNVFQSTIRSRIAVENMLELVHEGAAFSFDFFMLVLVASTLACIGLITNSSVVIVASMLVSPMMGPILGFTFGTVVRDRLLVRVGLRSELLGLLICVFVGFIGGLIAAPASMRQTPWPTPEMESRGMPSSLYIGAAIAIPSGVGVALSIMGQNTNSLVGVAISASLLPPCVNCGLLFAEASLTNYYFNISCGGNHTVWDSCCRGKVPGLSCPPNGFAEFCCFTSVYSGNAIASMGGISAALTIVNIICIWIFAALMFYLKEVAPLPGKSELWSTFVPQTRKFNIAVNEGVIRDDALKSEILKRQESVANLSQKNMNKERIPVIGRGGLQFDGGAGLVFGNFRTRQRNLFRELGALFEVDKDEEEVQGLIV